MKTALVIGGGPAGLMAAEELARAGAKVTVVEAKPSLGRKFLMAGKSGLNLTKSEPFDAFAKHYTDAEPWLVPMLQEFGAQDVQKFANDLGQEIFTGSSGRVFPKAMKASPMLRAWLMRLAEQGVEFKTKTRWTGWHEDALRFQTPEGKQSWKADAYVFALGGASWSRLGSDGHWAKLFAERKIPLAPFGGANAGIAVDWSAHMQPHFGTPLKAVQFTSGPFSSRGEAIISEGGLEGGGIYSVSRGVREGHAFFIDLRPDWSLERVRYALDRDRKKATLSNHMRRVLNLKKHELALINELARPLPAATADLAKTIKNLELKNAQLRPMDEAISTSGGVQQSALSDDLMLKTVQGAFCAGEMLDWEAPTGGYLLTACFATGRTAGRGAVKYLGLSPKLSPV